MKMRLLASYEGTLLQSLHAHAGTWKCMDVFHSQKAMHPNYTRIQCCNDMMYAYIYVHKSASFASVRHSWQYTCVTHHGMVSRAYTLLFTCIGW